MKLMTKETFQAIKGASSDKVEQIDHPCGYYEYTGDESIDKIEFVNDAQFDKIQVKWSDPETFEKFDIKGEFQFCTIRTGTTQHEPLYAIYLGALLEDWIVNGQIKGHRYLRDGDGNIRLDANGKQMLKTKYYIRKATAEELADFELESQPK